MMHPYRQQPPTAFWSRAVARDWDPAGLCAGTMLRRDDRIASLGSCFAATLVPYLKRCGFHYVEKEKRHPAFAAAPPDGFYYDQYSAAYGNIYTARQCRQLLERALGRFKPVEDRWRQDDELVDPFRPGLSHRARSDVEFDALSAFHLGRVRAVFEEANVVIFTLGLTEAWVSRADGAVFPACPGTVAGEFDAARHAFHNFTVGEIVADLREIHRLLREIKPDVRLILTVSPVPLVATATREHVLSASTYSKSVLRAACGLVCEENPAILYFPAYEIITGPQAGGGYFEPDRRSVTPAGVEAVMAAFLAHCGITDAAAPAAQSGEQAADAAAQLSSLLVRVECEEAAVDGSLG